MTSIPTYSILHVTRPKGTLCGLPSGPAVRTLKLGAKSCATCLDLLEQQINDRYGKGK